MTDSAAPVIAPSAEPAPPASTEPIAVPQPGGSQFKMAVEWRDVESITPYIRNAKKHPTAQVDRVAGSVAEFGWDQPIVVDGQGVIIKGHGRREAAMRLGIKQVPVVVRTDLSDAQVRASRIADNRSAESDWDDEMLALEMRDLKTADYDLSLTAFDEGEINDFLAASEPAPEMDPDVVPENVETRCKPGDLWVLGGHRLLCGDSTSADDVTRLFGGERAELCFTSPPYADQRQYNGGKELSTEHLATFIRAAYGQVELFAVNLGLSRKGGEVNQYWDDYIKEAKACGLKLLSWNVWDKGECGSIGNQTAMFGISHEWIFVFGAEPKALNRTVPNKFAGDLSDHTTRQADGSTKRGKTCTVGDHSQLKTVYQVSAQKARDDIDHPARFPVEFPEGYIEACTSPGQAVYEPFTGSGSTLIACEKTGRRCFGMELAPTYCDVILKRWEDATGKQAVLIASAPAVSESSPTAEATPPSSPG